MTDFLPENIMVATPIELMQNNSKGRESKELIMNPESNFDEGFHHVGFGCRRLQVIADEAGIRCTFQTGVKTFLQAFRPGCFCLDGCPEDIKTGEERYFRIFFY